MASSILRRARSQNLTLIGRLRSLSSESRYDDAESRYDGSESSYDGSESNDYEPISGSSDLLYKVYENVDLTTSFVKHLIEMQSRTGIMYKALNVICYHSIFNTCSDEKKLQVLSTVFDQIRNHPQATKFEVFLMEVFIRSMSKDDTDHSDLTRDEVVSRVIDVVQSYPKVGQNHKVTEETRFHHDLGFDGVDYRNVENALELEFNIYMPKHELLSCKQLIDYIYDNRLERCVELQSRWERVLRRFSNTVESS